MAVTTSFSLHLFSDDDVTSSRVYSTLSADNAPPYPCEMPFVRPLALHIMRASDYVLTGVNNDDLAIATRHDLLQRTVSFTLLLVRELAHLEVGRVSHYHPPRSRLFKYRVDFSAHLSLVVLCPSTIP
jgi:hypothetical protein